MSSNGDGASGRKRPRLDTPDAAPPGGGPNALNAIMSAGLQRHLFQYLGVEDAMRLSETSRGLKAQVDAHTILPDLEGVRTNRSTGQRFWSTEPATEHKRYFKPMSALGVTSDVPHISEQTGHPSHATDVGTRHWDRSGSGRLPAGPYPTKVQFADASGAPGRKPPYTLGAIDVPVDPGAGRVLTWAPIEAREPPNTLIPTRDYARALDVPTKGPLPASRQRTVTSTREAMKPIGDSQRAWHGARITGRDRPPRGPRGE